MEILLIDLGALALFLGFMGFVYWHGVAQPLGRRRLVHPSRAGRAPSSSDHTPALRRGDSVR